MTTYKIAIIHDYLCGMGGSERVFSYICEEFSEADIYTLAYNPDLTLPEFRNFNIRVTWLNKFVKTMEQFRWSFPIATHVMAKLPLKEYDIVLTSSATVAKYVNTGMQNHICYCYIPTRAIWQTDVYFSSVFKRKLFQLFLNYLRRGDLRASENVSRFISISENTRQQILGIYGKDSAVINSPIVCENFTPSSEKHEYYLLVSRLEAWKMVDYAIEAFNQSGRKLKIIGTGSEEVRLKKKANENIEFLGYVDDEELAKFYASAKAVVFTPELEYGLIPLEANAAGTPVICYGVGGVQETMIPYVSNSVDSDKYSAIFYHAQTAEELNNAIQLFESLPINQSFLVEHAQKWDVKNFKKSLREFVNQFYEETSGRQSKRADV
ncbi:glycosyltransferase [Paracoccaceae bacterium]|nr:glycosyltransferase [Paracoccaceae bacterium]